MRRPPRHRRIAPRRYPLPLLRIGIALALLCVNSGLLAQNVFDAAPSRIRRPQPANRVDNAGEPVFEKPTGAPKNPSIGKIVWVSPDGRQAVAWLDRPLNIPNAYPLGVRDMNTLADAASVRVVLLSDAKLQHPTRTLGIVVEKGTVLYGQQLCVPGIAMTDRLAKLP